MELTIRGSLTPLEAAHDQPGRYSVLDCVSPKPNHLCSHRRTARTPLLGFLVNRRRLEVLFLISCFAALLCFLAGCTSGDRTLADVDPDAAPANPTYEQVVAILDRSCVPCHSAGNASPVPLTSLDSREGGEGDDSDPDYDSCEGIQDGLSGIIDTAISEASMPPGAWPRLNERERLILIRWIGQGACSPCTDCQ